MRKEWHEEGWALSVRESYEFPEGDVYRGELSLDGEVLCSTPPCKTMAECRGLLVGLVDGRLAMLWKDIGNLKKIKEHLEEQ